MKRIREVIVVEGKYDAIRLHSAVDATILQTDGFQIFKDEEQLELLRRMARERGLIVFTDSDGAGFVIRSYLSGAVEKQYIKHAYIPEIVGKERRKSAPSKEGLLGVEGVDNTVILEALRRAGATFEDEQMSVTHGCALTKADLFEMGLVGGTDSAVKREQLQHALRLPAKLSANRLLQVLNTAVSKEEFENAIKMIEKDSEV